MNYCDYNYDGMMMLLSYQAMQYFTMPCKPPIYLMYKDGSKALAQTTENLMQHAQSSGMFGIDKDVWENLPIEVSDIFRWELSTYEIYQIKEGTQYRNIRGCTYNELIKKGTIPDLNNYESVYKNKLYGMCLDDLWVMFNKYHPVDYFDKSMSMSDIIVLNDGNDSTAYYVDRFGFKNVTNDIRGAELPEKNVHDNELQR